ncbi:hypothetical protein [Actinomadura rugatobispora]|uniref:Uncharacterized protein n=1 Tax=Actinomadura rugatobispora TaxID=1994 RepID=A0ABW0ZRN4_9ACTN|nr:hypothetical protein GCM10010200_027420 [Actinomadura rugatobispora]
MALEFLGADPTSEVGGSPSVWRDTETGDYVLRGWVISDSETRAQIGQDPAGEISIRFPQRMMQFFPEVDSGGGTDV